jgi:hypothetical protein
MKYIKNFNENVKSDNIFYFSDGKTIENIEESVIHLKDIMDNYRISEGWLINSDDGVHFEYSEHVNLERASMVSNEDYTQCYKLDFWNIDDDMSIEYDGSHYTSNINSFLKISNELDDINSKMTHFNYKMNFNIAVESISLIIYPNKKVN